MESVPKPSFVFDFPLAGEERQLLAFAAPRDTRLATQLHEVRPLLQHAERTARGGAWVAAFVLYEAAAAFDSAHRVHECSSLPLAWCGVFDAPLPAFRRPDSARFEVASWQPSVDRARFNADIASIRECIACGDVYQVNYTFRLCSTFAGDDLAWFMRMRGAQPNGYCAYFNLGRYRILSASPELFFRRDVDRLMSRPMKGTAPRGSNPAQDESLATWLQQSAKNRAENAMIVDVLRNDLSRIATPGTVRVPALFTIERYPTVLQMTSTVTATARPGVVLDDIFTALFPCGSISGAPKISALQVIAELEGVSRGIYCGAIGLMAPGGDAVFNVAIRTVMLDTASGRATCGIGGGITWDSSPEEEYDEALCKCRFLTAHDPVHA